MNLVVGSTGFLGSEICRRLLERGERVRALVRSTSAPEKVDELRRLGAEIAVGDLQDRASLERALRGVRAVVSSANTILSRTAQDSLSKTDRDGHLNLIGAAKKARVERFIFISFTETLKGESPLHDAKQAVEKALQDSGISYTILRPTLFMEVWLSPALGFDVANRKAQLFGTGDQPLTYISAGDVAEFAVQSLNNPAAANKGLELGGPEVLTPKQVVGIFEQTVGQKFDVALVPEGALREQYANAPDEYSRSLAGLGLGTVGGDRIDMRQMLRDFPVKLTSVRDYARRVTGK